MVKCGIAGISLGLLLVPATAMAQADSRVGAPPVAGMPARPMPMMAPQQMRRMLPPQMPAPANTARWQQVPGGWSAYRRPSYGYTLPRYWTAPSFYIADWNAFGLSAPSQGYGWSRYYDDYVLTDRWGRVYDWREGRARDGREDYGDSYGYRDDGRNDGRYHERRNDGVGGTVAGAVVGGVAGNLIAGRGNRVAGTLIGGGVGAIAGGAIERSATHDRRRHEESGGHYGGPSYPPFDRSPHWDSSYVGQQQPGYAYRYDYGAQYGGGTTVTTVIVDSAPSRPIVTRSVSYVTEYVSVPVRHRAVRHYRPRVRCGCGS